MMVLCHLHLHNPTAPAFVTSVNMTSKLDKVGVAILAPILILGKCCILLGACFPLSIIPLPISQLP
ncbi:unnamed protein product [Musa acuminata subsp. malaccensis]|uniref:(wild Malaysian banana) hypothetical protein n=1 Tax=Musa acuminata subsp. malaccensis TaxID=214687 RepID=A0A804HM35_MUSAM|nr:unnamed protein product [Musa acuminata subsp. malaccensis]